MMKSHVIDHLLCLAIPFFYIHLGSTYNKVGIVVLITYVALPLVHYALPSGSIEDSIWYLILNANPKQAMKTHTLFSP